jgi:hypothetical protein
MVKVYWSSMACAMSIGGWLIYTLLGKQQTQEGFILTILFIINLFIIMLIREKAY